VEAFLILMDNHNIHQFSVNRVGQYDLHCLRLLDPGRGSTGMNVMDLTGSHMAMGARNAARDVEWTYKYTSDGIIEAWAAKHHEHPMCILTTTR
jgi:hypothetical protein